jgi:hypothetical protein
LEVINLAIENDPDGTVLVREWLMTADEIDDAEAVEAEPDVALEIEPGIVRPAARDRNRKGR